MRRNCYLIFMLSVMIFTSVKIWAQQSNFSVSPPPVQWYEFSAGPFNCSPYFMLTKLEGKTSISVSEDGVKTFSGKLNVSSTYCYNWGLDITYVPYKITLSSLLQIAAEGGGNSPYRTLIISLAYNF